MLNTVSGSSELNYSDCNIEPRDKLRVNSLCEGELNGVIKYLKSKIARELLVSAAKLVSCRNILPLLPKNLESIIKG